MVTILTEVSAHLNQGNQITVLPIALSLKSILSISYVATVVFSSLKQQYTVLYINGYKAAYCPEHAQK